MTVTSHSAGELSPALENAATIDWSRFLGRPLNIGANRDRVAALAGKTVLITGAAGSIGSALARNLMNTSVKTLLLLDRSRSGLQALRQECSGEKGRSPGVEFFHADILGESRLREIFSEYRPHIVFHAAALKHLPALETAPFDALDVNVLGTQRLLDCVDRFETECLVNISTDKAVNPTSILGVSKRIAELLVLSGASRTARTASLRMGNVLGSSGSVVPLFLRSLISRRPLEITDPGASRYFVTMEEAVSFLLAASNVRDNSLLLPAMGRPKRIAELADFLLDELSCEHAKAMRVFTGLRDGEKHDEHLTYQHESLGPASGSGLCGILNSGPSDTDELKRNAGRVLKLAAERRASGLIEALRHVVPEFTASAALQRYVH